MCLIIERYIEPTIATKDIVVYKDLIQVSETEFISPYYSGDYTLNELATSDIKEELNENYWSGFDAEDNIDNNLHAVGIQFINSIKDTNLKVISKGLHSVLHKDRLALLNGVLVQCIIPKGAKYMVNKSNLVVSDKLIPIKIVENE